MSPTCPNTTNRVVVQTLKSLTILSGIPSLVRSSHNAGRLRESNAARSHTCMELFTRPHTTQSHLHGAIHQTTHNTVTPALSYLPGHTQLSHICMELFNRPHTTQSHLHAAIHQTTHNSVTSAWSYSPDHTQHSHTSMELFTRPPTTQSHLPASTSFTSLFHATLKTYPFNKYFHYNRLLAPLGLPPRITGLDWMYHTHQFSFSSFFC